MKIIIITIVLFQLEGGVQITSHTRDLMHYGRCGGHTMKWEIASLNDCGTKEKAPRGHDYSISHLII